MKKSVKTQGVRTNWSTPTRATVAASEGPSGVSGLVSLLEERLREGGKGGRTRNLGLEADAVDVAVHARDEGRKDEACAGMSRRGKSALARRDDLVEGDAPP